MLVQSADQLVKVVAHDREGVLARVEFVLLQAFNRVENLAGSPRLIGDLLRAVAGGDDYEDADEEWIVYTSPSDLMAVKGGLEEQGVQVKGAELTMIPTTPSEVSVADAKKVMRLIDRLEELEDLQNVYHTMDITDEIAAALEEE